MQPFNNTIEAYLRDAAQEVGERLPDVAIDAIRDDFSINDERGRCSNIHWLLGQFKAHFDTDSVSINGTLMNRYDFHSHGRNGLYPRRGAGAVIMTDDGYFRKFGDGLPRVKDSSGENREITGDMHRANENSNLRALHLLGANFHNKQRDLGFSYDECVIRSGYVWNNVFLASMAEILQMSVMEVMDHADGYPNLHREVVWHMQLNRFGHLLVPNTVGDRPLFEEGIYSSDVNLRDVLNSKGGKIGFRISNAMADGAMGGSGPSILDLTLNKRHNGHNCPTWGDIVMAVTQERVSDERYDWPAFAGLAAETEDDSFGPFGTQILATGFAQSLAYGALTNEGIYHNCDGLPTNFEQLLDYMNQ